jgi:uncharacterized RDD family membrane protein YckC
MLDEANTTDDIMTQRRYSTFSARVRAMVIDAFIIISAMVVGMLVLDAVETELAGRLYAIMMFALVFLYDPLLVSATGGTLGHRMMNIRVSDRDAERRIGLGRALLRTALKMFLGFLSFFFMAITRRHQALHDLATRSVIIINDVSRAESDDYVLEGTPVATGVSAARRVSMILLYSAAWVAITGIAGGLFVSDDCAFTDRCTRMDERIFEVLGLAWLLGTGTLMVLGWKGRLPGARRRAADSRELLHTVAAENDVLPSAEQQNVAPTQQLEP